MWIPRVDPVLAADPCLDPVLAADPCLDPARQVAADSAIAHRWADADWTLFSGRQSIVPLTRAVFEFAVLTLIGTVRGCESNTEV